MKNLISFSQYIQEVRKDVKGQSHFDFEGAKRERIEKEREEAASDREFDKETLYGRRNMVKKNFKKTEKKS